MQTALALLDFQFLDRQRRKLRRVMDTALRDLHDHLRGPVLMVSGRL